LLLGALFPCQLRLCDRPHVEDIFEQSYAIEPTENVTIRNGDGAVRVYGSTATELSVHAIKRAYTPERLKQIVVNVSVRPGSVSIETTFPKKPTWGLFDRSGTVDYSVVVPQTASISRLELDNGEVLVDGMHGQTMHARLGSSQMFEHNCFSDVVLSLGRGALTLAYEWWGQGRFSIRANIARGNVWAFFPSDAAFHLIAKTVRGKIANDFAEQGGSAAKETSKVDALIHSGDEAAIQMHVRKAILKLGSKTRDAQKRGACPTLSRFLPCHAIC